MGKNLSVGTVAASAETTNSGPDAQGTYRCTPCSSALPSLRDDSKYSGEIGEGEATVFYLIAEQSRGDCSRVLIAGTIGCGEFAQDDQSIAAGGMAIAGCCSRKKGNVAPLSRPMMGFATVLRLRV